MSAECSVCCENFSANCLVYSTPCGHIFHDKCIVTWIANSLTCPQCRHRTIRGDLRRLYFNINLNSSRMDLNSTASIIEMYEKERTIATLRQLNADLISENERGLSKLMGAEKKHLERISMLEQQLNKMHEEKEKLSANFLSSEREKDRMRNEFKIEKRAMEAIFRGDKEKMLDEFKIEKIKLMRQHKDDLEKVQLNQRSNADGTAVFYTAPAYCTRSNPLRPGTLARADSDDCVIIGTMPGPTSKKSMLKKTTTTSSRTVASAETTATERARRTVNSLNSVTSTATASEIAARKKLSTRVVRKPLANSTNAQKK